MIKLKKYLPMIVGILIAIPLAFGAFFLTQGALTRAGSTAPVDVLVTNIKSSSATITWTTDKESVGVVEYGTSPSQLVFFAPEATAKSQHAVTLTLLQSKTPYYFVIRIGDEVHNKDGIPYTFTTHSDDAATAGALTPPPDSAKVSTSGAPLASPTAKLVISTCIVTTDCAEIQKKFGKGCSTSDFIRCLKKNSASGSAAPTTAPTSGKSSGVPSPTFVPAQLKSPTPTP